MKLLQAILKDFFTFFVSLFRYLWQRPVLVTGIGVGLLTTGLVLGSIFISAPSPTNEETRVPAVRIISAGNYQAADSEQRFSGTVEAVAEADVSTEVAGRITSVQVQRGASVSQNTILATVENSAARAAVTQAAGALAAAEASASQSTLSIDDADTSLAAANKKLQSTLTQAYATLSTVNVTTVNQFYIDTQTSTPHVNLPNSYRLDGLLINFLNSTKRNLDERLTSTTNTPSYEEAVRDIDTMLSLLNRLIQLSQNSSRSDRINGTPLNEFTVPLLNERSRLDQLKTSLEAAHDSVLQAENNLKKAQLGGDSNTPSVATAQVTQARGALQAAQANLAKTVIRAPISGTVSALHLQTGDYVSAFSPAFTITNKDTVKVTTYLTPEEISNVTVGQTVALENKATGTISSIGVALDPTTRKIPITIYTDSQQLTPGTTITVSMAKNQHGNTGKLFVPLTAIKTDASGTYVFTAESDTLVAQEVTTGDITGNTIEILQGLESGQNIVEDMRGRSAGETVRILSND